MATRAYIAMLRRDPDGGYTVTFPDLPGVVTEGDTFEDALRAAGEALEVTLHSIVEDDGEAPPPALDLQSLQERRALPGDALFALVTAELPDRAVRVNISMEESLLARLDRAAAAAQQSRSGFIAEAVNARLRERAQRPA